jgi:hypothetical protein
MQGCSIDDDCDNCFTPPAPFVFDFLDKLTEENLFLTDTYQFDDLKIIDRSDDSEIIFDKYVLEDVYLIGFNTIGWESESVEYDFFFNDQLVLTMTVVAERVSEDCCTYTRFLEIEFEHSEFQFNSLEGVYKVFVEL